MKDNLTQNNDEKDIKRKENKSLEENILDDIDAYEAENVNNEESKETSEDKKEASEISEPANEDKQEENKDEPKQTIQAAASGESNYQINLINENLLRIRVKTKKGVNIDCSVKDTKSLSETQSNRLYLHPKPGEEIQEVEIIISIDPSTGELIVEKKKDENGQLIQPAGFTNFTPNPAVENLIMPVDLGRPDEPLIPLTEDEVLEQKIGKKNPFHLNRLLYRRNMTIGIISAVVFACISALLFYNFYGKTETKTIEQEKRLIVINDLPVKINFKEYEDPNKPKEEPKTEDGTDPNKITPPVIKNNIIRAPKINRPKINIPQDTNLTNDATKQLDSLRQLAATNDSIRIADSLKTANNNYTIPDSMKADFSDNTFGLKMQFPKNWSLSNPTDVNPETKGVLLVDTAAGKGTINVFIVLDNSQSDFKSGEFKTLFPVNDSSITAYVSEPRTLAGFTTVKYYMFLKTDNLSISMQVRKQFYDQYKPIVDAMVKTITIDPPPTPPK
jgi:hypothetical protein